jgi:NADPH-dependent 2,4-dienoyl-CoA reductase/sulfur reductase-like enzyme
MGDNPTHCDLLVIGAGPAGMSAATAAAGTGLDVLVIDEKPHPGGQIYAGLGGGSDFDRSLLGPDYTKGADLIRRFRASPVRYRPNCMVWDLDARGAAHASDSGSSFAIQARHVIVATGASERPLPFPGWTLPGVMTAGGAQLLLKTAGIVPEDTVVLAGSGPLLLLLATQYVAAGVPVSMILDMGAKGRTMRVMAHAGGFISSPLFRKGVEIVLRLRRAGVKVVRGVTGLQATGTDRLEHVHYRTSSGEAKIAARHMLIHHGIEPETRLIRLLHSPHQWHETTRSWRPACDTAGRIAQSAISIAGDCRDVGGAEAAAFGGELAALNAALTLGSLSRERHDHAARAPARSLARLRRARPFIEALYPPCNIYDAMEAQTKICRCEEITAAALREALDNGLVDINSIKSQLRCGMGPCQGRMCETTVREIAMRHTCASPQTVGQLRIRPPIKPVDIGEIIGLSDADLPSEAVIPGVPAR